MSFFKSLFSKKKQPSPPENPKFTLDEAMLQSVIDYIKREHGLPACRIVTENGRKPGLTQSKFGGRPYWPANMEYPKTPSGEALLLLAQINFSEISFDVEPLPKTGLLQFYIADDLLNGLNFDDQTAQTGFRLVFHPNPTEPVTEGDLISRQIPSNEDLTEGSSFPFYKEIAIRFEPMTDYPNASTEEFDRILAEALTYSIGLRVYKDAWSTISPESYDKIAELLNGSGHHMLGYPFFTQSDPRSVDSPLDTLLFQMDSESPDIMWGDSGVCHFFISKNDIKKQDFSKVLYNWDCY